jgi:hypothetical protein
VSPLTPDQIIADYRRRKQEQYACPHHDLPLVCGECGFGDGVLGIDLETTQRLHRDYPTLAGHPFRPAHRVDGVLVECTA